MIRHRGNELGEPTEVLGDRCKGELVLCAAFHLGQSFRDRVIRFIVALLLKISRSGCSTKLDYRRRQAPAATVAVPQEVAQQVQEVPLAQEVQEVPLAQEVQEVPLVREVREALEARLAQEVQVHPSHQ